MKKTILTAAFASLVIALLLGLLALGQPGLLRQPLQILISRTSGLNIKIDGDLTLQPGVLLGLTASNISIENPAALTAAKLARIGRLALILDLGALANGELVLQRLIIEDAQLSLQQDRQGRGNWERRLPAPSTMATNSSKPPLIKNISLNAITIEYRRPGSQPVKTWIRSASITATLHANGFSYEGQVDLNSDRLPAMHGQTRAGKAKGGQLKALIELSTDGEQVNFAAKEVTIGKSHLRLHGSYRITSGRHFLAGEFNADPLQLKDFLGEQIVGQEATRQPTPEPDPTHHLIPDLVIDTSPLRNWDLDLRTNISHLLYGPHDLGTYQFTATTQGGRLLLNSTISSRFFSHAAFQGELTIGADNPGLSLHAQAKGLDYGGLLKAFGVSRKVQGKLALSLNIQGQGKRLPALLANGNGTLRISGGKGEIEYGLLRLWGGPLSELLLPTKISGRKTSHLNCLAARYRLEPGLLKSEGMVMDTDTATISGAIRVKLPSEQIQGRFQPKPKSSRLFTKPFEKIFQQGK